ncbi:MAG: hypothetical protein ACRBN8_43260 [Nannocystales bacterium]
MILIFLELWPDGGRWALGDQSETPDAMIESRAERVGLEVTSATLPHIAKSQSIEDRLIALANRSLPADFPPVSLWLSFSDTQAEHASGSAGQARAVEQLLNLAAEVGAVSEYTGFDTPVLEARGMFWVRHVAIVPFTPPQVIRAGSTGRGERPEVWVQSSINKKSKKIDAYRRGTKERGGKDVWLLVTVGGSRQDHIMVDRWSAMNLHRGSFDRTFVLDQFENRVTELSARSQP